MNLSILEDVHQNWREILVIGRTIERDDKKYHLLGMTLSDEANLYIIEPFTKPVHRNLKGVRNQRRIQKEHERDDNTYLHCSEFCIGGETMKPQSGSAGPLRHSEDDYRTLQLFFDMMSAGWTAPDWLKEENWDNLQLVTLTMAGLDKLPPCPAQTPITIRHAPIPVQHIVEKPVTLRVGKSCSFSFTDACGEQVVCHINNVSLIDVWEDTAKELANPEFTKRIPPEQLQELKEHHYSALNQNCPKGMCYIGVEYECSKNLSLTFYSKQFLSSRPEVHHGTSSFFLMRLKPDRTTGSHGLLLNGCVIQTPVAPDTTVIPAELFLYIDKVPAWVETVI